MQANSSPPIPFSFALGLGLIGALGPSAVDMYLSSLPEIASHYQASFTRVQLTLTFFLLAIGVDDGAEDQLAGESRCWPACCCSSSVRSAQPQPPASIP